MHHLISPFTCSCIEYQILTDLLSSEYAEKASNNMFKLNLEICNFCCFRVKIWYDCLWI